MKKFALAAAFVGAASTAFAGGMAEPMMEMSPVVVMEEAAGSSGAGLIVPLILVALLAVAVSD